MGTGGAVALVLLTVGLTGAQANLAGAADADQLVLELRVVTHAALDPANLEAARRTTHAVLASADIQTVWRVSTIDDACDNRSAARSSSCICSPQRSRPIRRSRARPCARQGLRFQSLWSTSAEVRSSCRSCVEVPKDIESGPFDAHHGPSRRSDDRPRSRSPVRAAPYVGRSDEAPSHP